MVVFSCNSCGDSVKKNQVEKHIFRCRQCTVLSCLDCGKEFWGDEYRIHNQCISEEEKYSGKNFEPKSNANKGKKKQDEWMTILRENLSLSNATPSMRNLVDRILVFENIPRKKSKFENFIRNCLQIKESNLIGEVWSLISKAWENVKKPNVESMDPSSVNGKAANTSQGEMPGEEIKNREVIKQKRKEKKKSKSDLEMKQEDNSSENLQHRDDIELGERTKKCKRKVKNNSSDNGTKKKKHSHLTANGNSDAPADQITSPVDVDMKKPDRFHWTGIITSLLETTSGNELLLKKLKKKVLGEYLSRGYSKPITKEQLHAKLLKKIQKNPALKLHKERVKLIR